MKVESKVPHHYQGLHYDLMFGHMKDDIPFYLRQIKKYGEPVLELACGTGRIAIPLAEKGIRITGLDITDSMLDQAGRKAAEKGISVEWIKADCRNFSIAGKFNLIFFPFNSIAVLHEMKDIEDCLSCVRKHLTDDGRFVIDFFNPKLSILMRDPSKRYPSGFEYPDPDGKGTVVLTENNVYDAASQINRIKWYFSIGGRDEVVEDLNLRIFYPQELDAILKYNGFKIDAKFGNYDETPFQSTSPKQLIICHKQ